VTSPPGSPTPPARRTSSSSSATLWPLRRRKASSSIASSTTSRRTAPSPLAQSQEPLKRTFKIDPWRGVEASCKLNSERRLRQSAPAGKPLGEWSMSPTAGAASGSLSRWTHGRQVRRIEAGWRKRVLAADGRSRLRFRSLPLLEASLWPSLVGAVTAREETVLGVRRRLRAHVRYLMQRMFLLTWRAVMLTSSSTFHAPRHPIIIMSSSQSLGMSTWIRRIATRYST
jgi:hypothetical protein